MCENSAVIKPLPEELSKLLKNETSVKILGTLNADGSPYVVPNETITTFNGKTIVLSEELEKTQSNRNLVRSIWFDRPAVVCISDNHTTYEIRVKVHKCLIVGEIFDRMLSFAREKGGPDADIVTAWELIPEESVDISPDTVRAEQKRIHPYLDSHLDRASLKA
jgi:hypothetical protein